MIRKGLVSIILITCLLVSPVLMAQTGGRPVATTSARPMAAPPPGQTTSQGSESVRPQPPAQRRSYERETRRRHHSGISKKEVVFLAAVAGTSMGVGALAGGAKGLAIGAIVGGWGAYAAHRMWNWIR